MHNYFNLILKTNGNYKEFKRINGEKEKSNKRVKKSASTSEAPFCLSYYTF